MKTARKDDSQNLSRYGKSVQLDNKFSESFFNPIKGSTLKKFNTIAQSPDSQNITEYVLFSDEKIQNLTTKNERLKLEIRKIQKVLTSATSLEKLKPQYGIKLPQIRSEVADRELQNAYKQIKFYELQIQKLRNSQNQGPYSNRLTKSEKTFKQKLEIKQKLKSQLQQLQKTSKTMTKSLMDDRTKNLLQSKYKKLNDELKVYQNKLNEEQRKKTFFLETQRKKTEYILELEKKLNNLGLSESSMSELKRRIFQCPEKINKDQAYQYKERLQDRSPTLYNSLCNEIKLLLKANKNNENIFLKLESEKQMYFQKNKSTRGRIEQTQKQIQLLEEQITFYKKHIDPEKLKPNIKTQLSSNSRLTYNSISVSISVADDASNDPLVNKNKQILEHHFQFVQVGVISRRSEKFNDRRLLGKRSAKIVGVEIYQNRMQLLGFRFTYYVKDEEPIQGQLMQVKNENERYLQKKQFKLLPNDYIASVQCFLNARGLIVGTVLITQLGKIIKGGILQGEKRFLEMSPKQYPACVFACISKEGIELLGVEKVQPQSF